MPSPVPRVVAGAVARALLRIARRTPKRVRRRGAWIPGDGASAHPGSTRRSWAARRGTASARARGNKSGTSSSSSSRVFPLAKTHRRSSGGYCLPRCSAHPHSKHSLNHSSFAAAVGGRHRDALTTLLAHDLGAIAERERLRGVRERVAGSRRARAREQRPEVWLGACVCVCVCVDGERAIAVVLVGGAHRRRRRNGHGPRRRRGDEALPSSNGISNTHEK